MLIQITIISPNDIFREGFRHILEVSGFSVTSCLRKCLGTTLTQMPDDPGQLMLIEPDSTEHGVALCKRIRMTHRRVRLVLICDVKGSDMTDAISAGALDGFILKNASCRPFIDALAHFIHGGAPLQDPQAALGGDPHADLNFELLTPRERQIVEHLVRGEPNKIIARKLGISEATVKVHLKMLLRKLRVDNRTQAALYAVRRTAAETSTNAQVDTTS